MLLVLVAVFVYYELELVSVFTKKCTGGVLGRGFSVGHSDEGDPMRTPRCKPAPKEEILRRPPRRTPSENAE